MASPSVPERSTSLPERPIPHSKRSIEQIREERKSLKRKQSALRPSHSLEWFDIEEDLVENRLEAAELAFTEQRDQYLGGMLGEEEWQKQMRELMRFQAVLREEQTNLSVCRRDMVKGQYILRCNTVLTDRLTLQELSILAKTPGPNMAKDFSDLLLSLFDEKEKRSKSAQSNFRSNLINQYKSSGPDGQLWCSILRRYADPDERTAAHLFPYFLGPTVMKIIFGEEGSIDLFSVRNGLIMGSSLEKKFDKHAIAIVPASDAHTEQGAIDRWKLKVVDKSQGKWMVFELGCPLSGLDGIELEFKSPQRPASRLLYLHYVICLLKARKRSQKPGWLVEATKNELVWATPGRYMRENMLKALAMEVGHDIEEEAVAAFGDTTIPDGAAVSGEHAGVARTLLATDEFTGARVVEP